MHEQTTKGFAKMNICKSRFNECKPFGYVSLWEGSEISKLKKMETKDKNY